VSRKSSASNPPRATARSFTAAHGTPCRPGFDRCANASDVRWAALTAAGVSLAVVAALGSSEPSIPGPAPARLAVHFGDAAAVAVLVLAGLTAVLFFALLRPRDVRRRNKKDDQEFGLYHEPPRLSARAMLLLLLLTLAPVTAVGWLVWSTTSSPPAGGGHAIVAPGTSVPAPPRVPPVALPPRPPLPLFSEALVGLVVVLAAASLALVLWLYLGDRLARWWAGGIFEDDVARLVEAAEDGLDDLRAEPDARLAIMKCYRRFEEILAASRAGRAAWQTPTEFMRTALERLPLPQEPVALLTGLFELSRFSDRPLGATEREAACDCVAEIRNVLLRSRHAAGAA
jgi:hypothetical protein